MTLLETALVIADIGGYTRYMSRSSLAHSQAVIAQLLEGVIDAIPELELEKLEGDAAFFRSRPRAPQAARDLLGIATRATGLFRARRDELAAEEPCGCEFCSQVGALRLKFVAHSGEVALQRVKRRVELAGVAVILVHRMLKNAVPIPEYLLVTDPVLRQLGPAAAARAVRLVHDFDGIGPTVTHYLEIPAAEEPGGASPRPPPAHRLLARARLEALALPTRLRLLTRRGLAARR